MSVLSPRGGRSVSFGLSPDELSQMRRLWEGMPELSAKAIAAQFGVTKNTVIGHRYRKGWKVRKPATKEPSTLAERCDAIDIFPPAGCCVYPMGHPRTEGFRFCGDDVSGVGAPYCAEHDAKCSTGGGVPWGEDPERRLKAAARLRALNRAQRGVA